MGSENVKNIQKTNKLCYWRKKTWRSSQDSNLHGSSELRSDALTKKHLSNFVIVWGGNLKLPPLAKGPEKKKHCLDLQNTDLMSWKLCAQRGIVWYSFSSNLNLTPCKLDAQKEINMHLFCWPTLWPFIPLPFHWHSLISHCLDQMTLQRGSVDRLYNFLRHYFATTLFAR